MIFTNILIELLVAGFVVLYSYFKWSYQYWKKKNVPYLEPSIPFGNIKSPPKRTLPLGLELEEFYKIAKANGWKHMGLYMMSNPSYLVCDLELCKQILTKDFNSFTDRGLYFNEKDDPISCHLFSMGGIKWKIARIKLSPTFTTGKMRSMFTTLNACKKNLQKYIETEAGKGASIDVKLALNKFGIDIIGSCAFGLDCNSFEDPNSPFLQYGRKAFDDDFFRVLRNFIGNSYESLAYLLGLTVFDKDLSDFFYKVVEDTVNYRRKNNVYRADFLQTLMELMYDEEAYQKLADGKPFTLQEVVSQSFVFFAAGFETSSTTMTFALYELARNQDVQDKVREEIKRVLKDGDVTYDSLGELKYMQKVIDETLRLYPPVPFITRQCVEDWKIPNTDTYIEKGTKVFIPIKGFHSDPEYYENPEKFDPERFDKKENIRPYTHMPFGEGPRICIGLRFGLMETKVGLATIIKNYRVSVNKKTHEPLEFNKDVLILQIKGDLWLDLEKLE